MAEHLPGSLSVVRAAASGDFETFVEITADGTVTAFNGHVDLGTGMHDIHTAAEWMDLREMWAAIELTLEIVALQADVPRP